MGRLIWGVGNPIAHIFRSDRGDLEFRILGKERFEPVAEVSFHLNKFKEARDFYVKSRKAFSEWFSSPPYQKSYKQRLKDDQITPLKEWEEIKKSYELDSSFDITPKDEAQKLRE